MSRNPRPRVSKGWNPPISGRQKSRSLPVKVIDAFRRSFCPFALASAGGYYSHVQFSKFSSYNPADFINHYFLSDTQPGIYSEIGRKARDLLFEDFAVCSKFRLDKYPFSAMFTHQNDLLAINLQDIFLGECDYSYSFRSLSNKFTLRTNSSFAVRSIVEQVANGLLPGLSFLSEFDTATPNSVELQCKRDYATFNACIGGLFHDTQIGASAVFGSKNFCLGFDFLFQTRTLTVTRLNAAVALTTMGERTTSLSLNEMGQVLIGSYHQVVDPDTSFGAQIRYSFVDRQPVLTVGVEHRFAPHLSVKARADTTGRVAVGLGIAL
ncbi:hypothetical protein HA466_0296090 [Hirschfeldia incana]|nr:hypothetical protein HA466_0296090 [Hirschfeldia incana]